MRIVGTIAIIVGVFAQLLLNGQVYSNAVLGLICGLLALLCGVGVSRGDPSDLPTGRMMSILGIILALWCLVMLPSAYESQRNFNERVNRFRNNDEAPTNAEKSRH